jgi:integrating conjugative element protein (TIGR03757 family)
MVNKDLPNTEAEAQAYWAKNGAALVKRYSPQLHEAAEGLNLAMQYRLDRLPAVVINKQAVVFGFSSVEQAIGQYLDHMARKAAQAQPVAAPPAFR